MKEIFIEPEDCWGYFLDNKDDLLLEEHILAEDKDYGIEITIGSDLEMPRFTVYLDGDVIHEDYVVYASTAEQECQEIIECIYSDYLDDIESTLQKEIDKQLMDEQEDKDWDALIEHYEHEDEISIQESQIADALDEFLGVICDGNTQKLFTPNEFEEIKDHFCEYIARNYNKKVFRPMYLEGEDGEDFFSRYPYDQMIFDS